MKDARSFVDAVRGQIAPDAQVLVVWRNPTEGVARIAQTNMSQQDILAALTGATAALDARPGA